MQELKLTKSMTDRINRLNKKCLKKDFLKEQFEMSVFSKMDNSWSAPCIRYDGRLNRDYNNIPLDVVWKSIRGADENWEDATIEHGVLVNHNADLIFHSSEKPMLDTIFPNPDSFVDIYYGKNGRYKTRKYDLVYLGYCTYKELPKIQTKTF